MRTKPRQKPRITPRRIIGLSLSPDLAAKVKIEAARRGLSLRKLFEEMWALYLDHQRRRAGDDAR